MRFSSACNSGSVGFKLFVNLLIIIQPFSFRPTLKLIPDNTEGYYKISLLHYLLGEADESLK